MIAFVYRFRLTKSLQKMGINASKSAQKVPEIAISKEQSHQDPGNGNLEGQGSLPSTPILTPKIIRENIEKEAIDPRSPSKHIARTPIELLPAAAEKLKSLALESVTNEVTETPLKKHIIVGIDPRSPTFEFQRTPIVISASPDKKFPEKLRNKNLDKVLKSALPNTTPKGKITPPKLLESCLVTPKPKVDAYKRKSFLLLETNVDFTETNLDNVIKENYLGKSLQNLYVTSLSEISDPRSPTIDFLRTPIQICQKVEHSDNIQSIENPLILYENNDAAATEGKKLQSEETSVSVETIPPISICQEPILLVIKDCVLIDEDCVVKDEDYVVENISTITESDRTDSDILDKGSEEPMSVSKPLLDTCIVNTDVTSCKKSPLNAPRQKLALSPVLNHLPSSAPVSPPTIISVTPKKSKSQPVTPPFIDLTADVKELDKKLSHLIYEDEKDLVVCPRIVKVKDQNRTPLGLRNGTEHKKSIQKLKVSDKPRKAEYAVSKIPVFKEKKVKVQCENTPPRSMRPKKSQWDVKDDTLVI